MRRHANVHQLPPVMGMKNSTIQRAKRERLHREQVGRPDLGRVVPQEGAPGLARWPRCGAPPVAADRPIADGDAQLEQLAPDALGAPEPVLLREAAIRARTSCGTRGRPSAAGSATTREAASRWRCQRSTVSGWTSTRWRRQSATRRRATTQKSRSCQRTAGTPTGAQRDDELLPQEQVLFQESAAAAEGGEHDADEE